MNKYFVEIRHVSGMVDGFECTNVTIEEDLLRLSNTDNENTDKVYVLRNIVSFEIKKSE